MPVSRHRYEEAVETARVEHDRAEAEESVRQVSGANGDLAAKLDVAEKRVRFLEGETRGLAEQLRVAIATLGQITNGDDWEAGTTP